LPRWVEMIERTSSGSMTSVLKSRQWTRFGSPLILTSYVPPPGGPASGLCG
jgi:hypothetical protein